MKASRGFTLIEVVIVVSALSIAVVLAVLAARNWKTVGEQAATVASAATSMEAFAKAAQAHVDAHEASWVLGAAPATITAAQLVTAGELAAEDVSSPLDQGYVAYVVRVDDKTKPRVVATESHSPSLARLDRLELPPGVNNLIAWQQEAARILKIRLPTAAVIAAGTTVATGSGFGWTKDLAGIAPAPSSPALAVLINFPDLAFDDAPPPPPVDIDSGNCTVAYPTQATLAACPADTTAVVSWPFCGRLNSTPNLPHADVYSSAIGALVVGSDLHTFRHATRELFGWACNEFMGGTSGCASYFDSTSQDAVAVLNGYEVGRNSSCVQEQWIDASSGVPSTITCNEHYSNEAGNFRACRFARYDPIMARWGVAGKNILCCRSR